MKPEMKMDGHTYLLTTHLGDTIKLNYYDMQEIRMFLLRQEWEGKIEEFLSDDCIELTAREHEDFIGQCMEEANNRYENRADEYVNIKDVYEYVAEDFGIL